MAHLFAAEGARIGLIDRSAEGLADVCAQLVAQRVDERNFKQVCCDISDTRSLAAAVEQVRTSLGPIDIVINNAGVSIPAPIDGSNYEEAWHTVLSVNLEAQANLIRHCLDDLSRRGDGRIVNIASTEGLGATSYASPYTVSKHGVIGLTRSLAVELGNRGVTVNCVAPGPILTGMTAEIDDAAKAKFARRRVPLRRYGHPEEVAHAVLSLALPASSYINGAVLVVDGGLTAQNT